MGSIWFADFVLFHKLLGLSDMLSFEREVSRRRRIKYNAPYACVDVAMELTTVGLPKLKYEKQTILWLDYDDTLEPYFYTDISIYCERALSGSFIIVSCNVDIRQLERVDPDEKPIPVNNTMREIVGVNLPPDYESRTNPANFPMLVSESLLNCAKSTLLDRRPGFELRPLFNFVYADGAPMLTVGFFLGTAADAARYDSVQLHQRTEFAGTFDQCEINLPNLTPREKATLDQFLPSAAPPRVADLPFELRPTEIRNYFRFYRYYPMYGEIHP
jgi:hypothetical protein